jgi:hypothetical protein
MTTTDFFAITCLLGLCFLVYDAVAMTRAKRAKLQALRGLQQSLGGSQEILEDMQGHLREMKEILGRLHAHFHAEADKQRQA